MIEIRPSFPGEIPSIRSLWELAFGDTEAYIDCFFACDYDPESMLLLLEDGVLQTMLYLMPMTLRGPGLTVSAHYIYALATQPAARGRGFGRQLLNAARSRLRDLGDDCATVVPANPGLHKFFGAAGFDECFSTRLAEFPEALLPLASPKGRITPVSPEDYNRLRSTLLDGSFSALYSDGLITFQAGLSRLSGGDLYQLELEGETGCAAAEYQDEDTVLLKELLIASRLLPQAVALAARRMPALRYHVRTPAWNSLAGSYLQPFGMIQWYNRKKADTWARSESYLGLGFD